jgi:hypothetical protein
MLTRSMTGAMTPLDRIRSARIVPVVAALLAPRELRLTADGG